MCANYNIGATALYTHITMHYPNFGGGMDTADSGPQIISLVGDGNTKIINIF